MNVPTKRLRSGYALAALALFLPGCDSRASRAAAAFNQYQAAAAAGDLAGQRTALLALVAANEDNPTYWVELGKTQLQLKNLSQAYYAFTRANELNRSDGDTLRFLTQIALQTGNLAEAEQHSRELDLVAPGDPMVRVTGGLIALKRNDFDSALRQADTILETAPLDSNATLLKARALVGLGRTPEATALLEQQVAHQPRDAASIKGLLDLARKAADYPRVVVLGRQYLALTPADHETALTVIEAAFRAGNIAAARELSSPFLTARARPEETGAVLDLWRTYWRGPEPLAIAARLGATAGGIQRVAYAHYLNLANQPAAALKLVASAAQAPPSPASMDARAIYFDALARLGRRQEARAGLQDVLTRDPDNDLALEAIAPLLADLGDRQGALNAARKLVTVVPASIDARLILVRSYELAGDRGTAERTLWDAFHEIPAAERIYTRLRAYLGPQSDEARRLDDEYAAQVQRKILQESA